MNHLKIIAFSHDSQTIDVILHKWLLFLMLHNCMVHPQVACGGGDFQKWRVTINISHSCWQGVVLQH